MSGLGRPLPARARCLAYPACDPPLGAAVTVVPNGRRPCCKHPARANSATGDTDLQPSVGVCQGQWAKHPRSGPPRFLSGSRCCPSTVQPPDG